MTRFLAFWLLALNACSRGSAGDAARSDRSASTQSVSAAGPTGSSAQAIEVPRPSAESLVRTGVPGSSPLKDRCDQICSRSRELACTRQERCVQGCLEMASIDACKDAFAKLYSCLAAEPVSHWECAEDGVAAIRDGYCEKEQADAARCVERQANQ